MFSARLKAETMLCLSVRSCFMREVGGEGGDTRLKTRLAHTLVAQSRLGDDLIQMLVGKV